MKKSLSVLLTMAMLLSSVGIAQAEPAVSADTGAVALPEVGEVFHGFEVIETREDAMLEAMIVRFEHRQTGAQVFYIANDDTNRAFQLTFLTDPIDNTGLPHVFEHACLQGSKKYPSKSLWFNLRYQAYTTYFNAHTGKWYTGYPIASLSEEQLLKLADYYTDSCFNPMILEDESIYRTEAWRYRLPNAEGEMTIEGTVYSEMLGATTLQRMAQMNAMRAMFPGSMVGNDSGGDPDTIPDMTWDMLKAYHARYYHPSNCVAYLYGQIENWKAFLQLLDGYFSMYERVEVSHDDAGYEPITQPVTQFLTFPVEQGSDTEHASIVYYGLICPGLNRDSQAQIVLDTLTDLMVDEASVLQQKLKKAIPYGRFSAYTNVSGPEDAIMFMAENVDPDDAELFKTTVDEALEEVARNGFPQDLVDGVMTSLSISALLSRDSSDPVDGVISRMEYSYACSGDPWGEQNYREGLLRMDEWNRQGLYAKAVGEWLVGSETTALVTTSPEPGAKEQKDAALAEKLAEVKAQMSDEEIEQIVQASNAGPEADDASEYVAKLQAVTVASLPEEIRQDEVRDETGEDGIRRVEAVAGVEGVGQASVFLDASGLKQEDIHWFKLYTDLLGQLDTSAHDRAELATLMGRYLYNGSIYVSTLRTAEGGYRPYLRLKWTALDDDLAEGYDLMREILLDSKLDDIERILEQVQILRSSLRSSITGNPFGLMARRALGISDELYRYSSYSGDLDYCAFLTEIEQLLQTDPDTAVAKLEGIRQTFNNRQNAITLFAGNEKSIELNRTLADAFLQSLDQRPIEPAEYDLPVAARSEALIIDSSVQYNMQIADYPTLGLQSFSGDLDAVNTLVSDVFLVPLLRDQYGVYSPQCRAITEGGVYLYAYRDPNIVQTYALYEQLPELLADYEVDQATLEGYILSSYSAYAMPEGALSGAVRAAEDVLQGRDPMRRLEWMRQLKQLTPEGVKERGEMLSKLVGEGVRVTAGGAASIRAAEDLYEVILNPFGAVDVTQVTLSDVPEGSEHYEAVHHAFEEGFMAAVDGERFGVDEPATRGDLLGALYVMVGGDLDQEQALAAFAESGMVEADTDLSGLIAPEDIRGLLTMLTGEEVPPLIETAGREDVTRGELAEALMAFVNSLEPTDGEG